jgi:adenine-specific DNA-methyltransferase
MDKLKMHSVNKVDENVEKIARLFPNCVTETIVDEKLTKVIDFDMLKQELSSFVVEGREERYQFTWPDKRKSVLLANAPINKTLCPCREESVNFDTTENLYIEGDNLEVLKLLQETYLGKIKMIYIDPPYNTGNDFVYEDDFAQDAGEYIANSGQYDTEGNRLVQNTESNGRFHTDWLNMIYPRIRLAKDLLTDDGVIFISIDDNEIDNLKKCCDEIFGQQNFVADLIWQSRTSISNDDEISTNHNHTLVYSKNRDDLSFGGDLIDQSEYINPDNDPKGPWKLVPIDANHTGGATVYPVKNPKTGVEYYPPNGRVWCYNAQTMQKLIADGRIKFGITDDSSPKRKLYYKERIEKGDKKTPSSLVLDAGTTKDGTITIMDLFNGKKVFDYPKSVEFIKRLIRYGTYDGKGIVLDFFSGSATTAHSIIEINNEDNGSRHFIMVQVQEDLDIALKTSRTKETIQNAIDVCEKLNVPHTICEIGKERIRRAGKKIVDEAGLTAQNLDIGFRVLKCDSSNMKDVYYSPSEYTPSLFSSLTDNIKEDRTPEDLLFQVMLDLGVLLSSKIEETTVAGKKVFSVADGYLIACFDEDITDETIKEIAQKKPYYFVMRDGGYASDSVATNFDQIFAAYSPSTIRKVL